MSAPHVYIENSADGTDKVHIEKDNAIFLSNTFYEIGNKHYEKKKIPEAIQSFENALLVAQLGLKLFKNANTSEPIELILTLRDAYGALGVTYLSFGQKADSFEHFKQCVKIQETLKRNDTGANTYFFHYAMLLFETKRFDEANVYVEKCLKSMHARLGDLNSCLYVTVYQYVGNFYYYQQHHEDQCLDFCKKANYIVLQIQKHKKCQDSGCKDCAEVAGPENVADTHANLAHILAKLQKHDEALQEFIKVFEIRAQHKLPLKDVMEHLIKNGRQNPKFTAALQQLHQKYQDAQKAAKTALVRHSSESACATCLRTSNLLLCSQCRTVRYCSPECQKMDWAAHKPLCSAKKAAREEERKMQELQKQKQEQELQKQKLQEDNDADPTNDD